MIYDLSDAVQFLQHHFHTTCQNQGTQVACVKYPDREAAAWITTHRLGCGDGRNGGD